MAFAPALVTGQPIWDMLGTKMPSGLLGLSDPDVHLIDGRWVMFIGGFSTSFRNRLYQARLPANTGPEQAGWVLDRRPISTDPPKGAWDAGGMHTPSYVPPHHAHSARIYYAGRGGARHYGRGSAYAIVLSLVVSSLAGAVAPAYYGGTAEGHPDCLPSTRDFCSGPRRRVRPVDQARAAVPRPRARYIRADRATTCSPGGR
ncbi:hypothetical protein [Micromonospora palythoicola]|uniref:hypothetical protein n=1 Tax=Micromonospora palythoicola TaxID=3120507 RepID=UPI002FCE0AF4